MHLGTVRSATAQVLLDRKEVQPALSLKGLRSSFKSFHDPVQCPAACLLVPQMA